MQNSASYTLNEFFYDKSFHDYANYSGIPYKINEKEISSLAIKLATLDNGEGVYYNSHEIEKNLTLNSYFEFKNCKIHGIDSPLFVKTYISAETLNIEKEFVPLDTYEIKYNEKFEGELFNFSGNFYIYSIHFYEEQNKYFLRIRGYEEK